MAETSCSLEEAAEICRIPGRTLWRWRADRLLTATADWARLDPADMRELLAGRRRLPWGARLDVEDVTRLLLVSHLGALGWERQKLMSEALGHPWAFNIQPGREPDWLLIFQPSGKRKLQRQAVATLPEVTELLREIPTAYVANLRVFRNRAAQAITSLDKERIHARA
jgi:hypothetical protein